MSKLHITIGVQGSGKSTWGKKFAQDNGVVYLSSDEIREKIGKGKWDQSVNRRAFYIMAERSKVALNEGKEVLLDGTFAKKAWRKDYITIGKEAKAKIVCHYFTLTDKNELSRRIKSRVTEGIGVDISEDVLDRYINMLQPPTLEEGFSEIIIH